METQEMIAIMQAYENGETIEFYNQALQIWIECTQPTWDWSNHIYRIKPKDEYIPYENAEEFIQEVLKHKGWIMTKNENDEDRCYYPIGAFCTADKGIDIISSNPPKDWDMSFEKLLKYYVWANDGTPCGKQKGGTKC